MGAFIGGAEVWDHVGDGGFQGDEFGEFGVDLGVFADAAADGGILLAKGGFVIVAGGGHSVGPIDRSAVADEQIFIVVTA